MPTATDCPCGSGSSYDTCCRKVHVGGAGFGVSAEQLMRARYSAYVLHDADFLLSSWHSDTRPPAVNFDPNLEWVSLEIVATERGSGLDTQGVVEFRARFVRNGEHLELHERSTFVRIDGYWVYIEGQ